MKNHTCLPLFLSLACAATTAGLSAAEITVHATADAYIRGDSVNGNGGTSSPLIVGQLASSGSNDMRALLHFDFSGVSIPAGATVNSVKLVLTVSGTDPNDGDAEVSLDLHQMTTSWSENEVTWNSASTGVTWTTSGGGGDYNSPALATTNVPTRKNGVYTWESTTLSGIVNTAISDNSTLDLLLKSSDETGTLRTLLRFLSREPGIATAPRLVIDYTPAAIPEPVTTALLLGGVCLGGVVLCRRFHK
ncbi:MAG: DNRLRE domain-containing protein [Opitutaceae bacterium]|jgi:hypothetical protein|nr:DNRLRE domain-containing protein [Opitutaceae bacterium]